MIADCQKPVRIYLSRKWLLACVQRLVVTGNVLPFLMAFRVSLVIPTRRSFSETLEGGQDS